MRQLNKHIVPGDSVNHQLEIVVTDEPGQGGACHHYEVKFDNDFWLHMGFQNGPIKEFGVNGITQEALLAILIDRLEGFQSGKFACEDNHKALALLEAALIVLQNRTRTRIARGVEGTHNA